MARLSDPNISAVIADLRRRLNGRRFAMLSTACRLVVADGLLRVEAINRFMRDWIERTLQSAVEDAAKSTGLRGVRICMPRDEDSTLFGDER